MAKWVVSDKSSPHQNESSAIDLSNTLLFISRKCVVVEIFNFEFFSLPYCAKLSGLIGVNKVGKQRIISRCSRASVLFVILGM